VLTRDHADKTRDNRLRHAACRQGYLAQTQQ
jgi:hypothetical protein